MREQSVNTVLLSVVLLCCSAQAPVLPGVGPIAGPDSGPHDRRQPVSVQTPPFDALVRVQTELGARCTGFLIAPTLVMTAAHCLYLPKVGAYIQPGSVHVLSGYRAGDYRAHARALRVRIASDYRPGAESATAGADRAILMLDHPVGRPDQVLPLAPPPAAPFTVRLEGYGQDRDEVAVESPGCSVTADTIDGEGRPLLVHDCQATAGTSGAPLVLRRADGRWAAVGVQIEARVGETGGVAVPALDLSPTGRYADR